ncbi:MAG: amidohydrolase [Candidatus Bathyarchaeota archaeon]|jgi:predicted amidohydrolase YtcJ|nr:amidohydrolase [Candidatus Bathyarchaeota archaeon]
MYADLVLLNGHIITLCEAKPFAEAVALKDNRIMKVGRNTEITQHISRKTKVIDLNGKTVIPGLIDSHVHVADFAKTLLWIDLQGGTSIEEIKNLVNERVEKTSRGKWIIGKGWDEEKLAEKRMPKASDIDEAAPENPVILYRAKGRVCVVNSLALQMVSRSINLAELKKGDIEIDPQTGKPSGILRNSATDLVWKFIPETSVEELAELIKIACQKILEMGITTVQWIASSTQELYAVKKVIESKELPLKVYLIVPASILKNPHLLRELKEIESEYFKVGGVIFSVDGYLASKTAALTKPYENSKNRGKLFYNAENMRKLIEKIGKKGLQVAIHAMGDRAIKETLKAIKKVSKTPIFKDITFRLETAALLTPKLIEKIAILGAVISVQPYMAYSELKVWKAVESIGRERARWLFPLKTLFQKGIIVAGGTDSPMEPLNVFSHIKTATATRALNERITVYEALKMYTLNAAYAMGEEKAKGTIERGKLADITVLSENLLATHPKKIDEIKVELTIVSGKIAYSNLKTA